MVAGKAVGQAEAQVQRRQVLGGLRREVLLEEGPELAVGFLVGLRPGGRLPGAQAAGLLDFRTEHAAPQVGRQRHDAIHRARPRQFVDQRAESADGNADQPDRGVALGPLGLDDVGVQPLAEGLVVVVGDVRIDQQCVGCEVPLAHGADETLALELLGFEVGPWQEDQERVGPFIVIG
ncbi:hypothetical protein D9M68_721170 [compost metagenome]